MSRLEHVHCVAKRDYRDPDRNIFSWCGRMLGSWTEDANFGTRDSFNEWCFTNIDHALTSALIGDQPGDVKVCAWCANAMGEALTAGKATCEDSGPEPKR